MQQVYKEGNRIVGKPDPGKSANERLITVEEYTESWVEEYKAEAERLREVFGELLVGIHHIGSTSVPGLAAKPVIDFLVEAADIDRVDELNDRMLKLGYEARGEYGIPSRRFFPKGGNQRSHHVHVFPVGHHRVKDHLLFRDYLRAFPEEARAYEKLKRSLADEFPHDIDGYCDGKDEFIKELNRRAERWAANKAENRAPGEKDEV